MFKFYFPLTLNLKHNNTEHSFAKLSYMQQNYNISYVRNCFSPKKTQYTSESRRTFNCDCKLKTNLKKNQD